MKTMKRALGLLLALGLMMSAGCAAACDDSWTEHDGGGIGESGKYKLTGDAASGIQVNQGDVTLCLHGNQSYIGVSPGANLTIVDCQGGGGGIRVNVLASGTVTMEAGSFGEVKNRGTFTMNGGKVTEGVTVNDGGTFTMTGGKLSTTAYNAALNVEDGRAFVTGGTIEGWEGAAIGSNSYLEVGGNAEITGKKLGIAFVDGGEAVITDNAKISGGVGYEGGYSEIKLTVGGNAEIESENAGIMVFGGSLKIDGNVRIAGNIAGIAASDKVKLSIAQGAIEATDKVIDPEYAAMGFGKAITLYPVLKESEEDGIVVDFTNPKAADERIIADGSYIAEGSLTGSRLVVDRIPVAAGGDLPSTGDSSMLGAWVCLLGASAAGIKLRRKK